MNAMQIVMMAFVIIILLIIVLAPSKGRKTRMFKKEKPYEGIAPCYLGADMNHPVFPLVKRYTQSWTSDYEERLKMRVLEELSGMTDSEYSWRKLELDRFYVICAILKDVPMFSSKVDALWHEMLMFTHDYDQWSTRYIGEKIHHQPTVERRPMPEVRAWFDWVYSQLFEPSPYTEQLWGKFFRYPLDPAFQQQLVHAEWSELERSVFRSECWKKAPEAQEVALYLIQQARLQMQQADEWKGRGVRDIRAQLDERQGNALSHNKSGTYDPNHVQWGIAASLMFIASTTSYDLYEEEMAENDKDKQSGCSASGCSTTTNDHSSSGGSDGDSGSSCGSSCGSGCGSS